MYFEKKLKNQGYISIFQISTEPKEKSADPDQIDTK
jgi:hypothetical protein